MSQALQSPSLSPVAVRSELDAKGCVMLAAYSLFSAEELAELDALCRKIPEETITLGDAGEPNDVFVGRFMVDYAGEQPKLVNRPHSDRLFEILRTEHVQAFFDGVLGKRHHIRRCQINRMVAGSFIGRHLDTDSNPDYFISVVIQLGRQFGGGEFAVFQEDGSVEVFKPDFGTVIIARCNHPHEVRHVTEHERSSLVYFYSENDGANRRH